MRNIRKNAVILALAAVVVYAVFFALQYFKVINEYNGQLLTLAGIYVIVSLSLNLISGFTGQLCLGQAGFMCIGAYTTAIAIINYGLPLPAALLAGGLMTALFGVAIGFPALRLRGDYLAITTLGFGEIVRVLIVNLEGLTGGAAGLKGIPPIAATGDFILDALVEFTWVYGVAILVIAAVSNLLRSSHGRAIVSIREDEIAANSMGINVANTKVFAFTLSAFIAGVGGGLYALFFGYLNPAMFGWLNSVNFVVIVVLGGMGSMTGTIIAAVVFTYLQEWLRVFEDYRLVVFGLALILVMIFWPRGLMGSRELSIVGATEKAPALARRFLGQRKNGKGAA